MGKIKVTKKEMYNMVTESIKRCLNEMYDRSKFYDYHSKISDNKEFRNFENIVANFTSRTIEYDEDSNKANFSDFIEGIAELKQMSYEKSEYDKMNIKEMYQKYTSEGREDDFWSLDEISEFEHIESYLNRFELWEKYMPTPERIDFYIDEFKTWLKWFTEYEIERYQREKWNNYRYYTDELTKI